MEEQGIVKQDAANPDIAALRTRAIESVTLAIELFNRPSEIARSESVLMQFHHGFEMILKSLIVEHTGTASDDERGYSYTFDTCLRIADEQLKLLDQDKRRFLSMLANLRDSAVHYYQELSEGILYIFAQASVSLFDELIRKACGKGLLEFLPGRVLPICGIPPSEVGRVVDDEFRKLQQLLQNPGITKQKAMAALRPLMAFKIGGEDEYRRMTTCELEVAAENLKAAETWRTVFPEIAKINFVSQGEGIPVGFKVVKMTDDALPVRVIKAGDTEEPQGVIIQREIDIFDKFNMGLNQVAKKLGVSGPRTLAMIREYGLGDDPESFRKLRIGSVTYKRYSKKTLDFLRGQLDTVEECWKKQGYALTHPKRKSK